MTGADRPVGLTRDAGWQIGVRRSVAAGPADVWGYLMSPEGLSLWVGPGATVQPERGSTYRTDDGTTGDVRSVRGGEMIRLTWHPAGWQQPSTLQVRVTANATGTSVGFHQERLVDEAAREAMRRRWEQVLDELTDRWS